MYYWIKIFLPRKYDLCITFCLADVKVKEMEIEKFIDRIIHLRVITEEIEQRNFIEKLKTKNNERKSKKRAKRIGNKKFDELVELGRSLNFLAIKIRFWGGPNGIKERLRLREITWKKINEIEKLETETKEMKRLKLQAMHLKISKLLGILNSEKEIETEEIKEIEIKLEKLKIPKTVVSRIKKLIISENNIVCIIFEGIKN